MLVSALMGTFSLSLNVRSFSKQGFWVDSVTFLLTHWGQRTKKGADSTSSGSKMPVSLVASSTLYTVASVEQESEVPILRSLPGPQHALFSMVKVISCIVSAALSEVRLTTRVPDGASNQPSSPPMTLLINMVCVGVPVSSLIVILVPMGIVTVVLNWTVMVLDVASGYGLLCQARAHRESLSTLRGALRPGAGASVIGSKHMGDEESIAGLGSLTQGGFFRMKLKA
mmetsp:Transcript_25404/g.64442  ORF Transcript_25404/g.64442 Transcript_25404/m.64442 type:complete len:227 (+) Transcript_25404:7626-8306(+)